jgi:ACS family D-galactonate transporter-like MFS transporter
MYWHIVLVLGAALFSLFSANTVISTLIPVISAQASLNPAQTGAILASFGYTYAAMRIPVGVISDRYEPRKIITISTFSLFVATFIFSFSSNFIQMLISRLIMGTAGSFLFVDSLKTIEMLFERRARGSAIGIVDFFSFIGITSSNLVAEFFLQSLGVSWQLIYRGTSLVVLSTSILAVTFLPSNIFSTVKETENRESQALLPKRSQLGRSSNHKSKFLLVIENKSFWVQTLVSFASFGSSFALVYWFPTFFESRDFGLIYGSIAVALIGIGSAIGALAGGFIVDKLKKRLPIIRSSLILYAGFLLIVIFVSSESRLWVIPLVASLGIGLSQGGLIANTRTIAELFPRQTVGTAFGIYNCVTWVGSATYPFVIGVILNIGLPFDIAFFSVIGSLVIAFGAMFASIETGNIPEDVQKNV